MWNRVPAGGVEEPGGGSVLDVREGLPRRVLVLGHI